MCVLHQVFKARHGGLCDHEQLACDLDRALSLSVLSSSRRTPSDPGGRDGGVIPSSGGKQKVRGQRKTVSPPLPHSSQRSSYDYSELHFVNTVCVSVCPNLVQTEDMCVIVVCVCVWCVCVICVCVLYMSL